MNSCPFFSEKMNLSNSQAALGVRGFPTVGSFTYQYFIGSLFVPLNQSMHRKIYPKTALPCTNMLVYNSGGGGRQFCCSESSVGIPCGTFWGSSFRKCLSSPLICSPRDSYHRRWIHGD